LNTNNWVNVEGTWTSNPRTGNDWQWSEINALEIGVELKESGQGNELRCTPVWVVVTYTHAP
jgi:hypothetical protein